MRVIKYRGLSHIGIAQSCSSALQIYIYYYIARAKQQNEEAYSQLQLISIPVTGYHTVHRNTNRPLHQSFGCCIKHTQAFFYIFKLLFFKNNNIHTCIYLHFTQAIVRESLDTSKIEPSDDGICGYYHKKRKWRFLRQFEIYEYFHVVLLLFVESKWL